MHTEERLRVGTFRINCEDDRVTRMQAMNNPIDMKNVSLQGDHAQLSDHVLHYDNG